MRRHPIVKAGLYPLVAAGTLLIVGGVAPPATASPAAAAVALPQDCDVIGGQPGGEHAPGGHDNHGGAAAAPTEDEQMDMDMNGDGIMDMDSHSGHGGSPGAGQMDHSQMGGSADGHGSHGSATLATPPESGTRTLVLGGFGAVNAGVLGAAVLARRRTGSRRQRHVSARAAARPARRITEGDEQ
jgi:hypothetical protein